MQYYTQLISEQQWHKMFLRLRFIHFFDFNDSKRSIPIADGFLIEWKVEYYEINAIPGNARNRIEFGRIESQVICRYVDGKMAYTVARYTEGGKRTMLLKTLLNYLFSFMVLFIGYF